MRNAEVERNIRLVMIENCRDAGTDSLDPRPRKRHRRPSVGLIGYEGGLPWRRVVLGLSLLVVAFLLGMVIFRQAPPPPPPPPMVVGPLPALPVLPRPAAASQPELLLDAVPLRGAGPRNPGPPRRATATKVRPRR